MDKMKEVVHMQIGRCGTRVGTKFWETVADEHGVGRTGLCGDASDAQLERVETYFKQVDGNKRLPRSVVVELESGSLQTIFRSTHRKLFQVDNCVVGSESAGNCFAKGFYGEGRRYVDRAMDVVRKEAEICDSLQGFDLNHSLGGGTGSGLGALIMGKVREEYPKCLISTFSTFPSLKVMGGSTASYNTILSLRHLAENANVTYCMDNEALYDMAQRVLKIRGPSYEDLNHLASMTMSGITTFLRFSGPMYSDLRALIGSMIPFSKLHFLTSSFVWLDPRDAYAPKFDVNRQVEQLFHMRNTITACDPLHGHYFGGDTILRGQISADEIRNQTIQDILIANNIKLNVCEIPVRGTVASGTLLSNTTAIKETFTRIEGQFEAIFRRKAFFHWYAREGMEEAEFTDAANYIKDLISEYINRDAIMYDKGSVMMVD